MTILIATLTSVSCIAKNVECLTKIDGTMGNKP